MHGNNENASLHWRDGLGFCGCGFYWVRTEGPMPVIFDQHNRSEPARAALQSLFCIHSAELTTPLVFLSVSLTLLQGFCRHSKPRVDLIPGGCAGQRGGALHIHAECQS